MSVSAVMVTYNPDIDVLDNIEKIARQVKELIIVDNSSPGTIRHIEEICQFPNVKIINLNSNYGIAHAFNVGIVEIYHYCDWIATFDQDTKIEDDYFASMLLQAEIHTDRTEKIGIIAPAFGGLPEVSKYKDKGIRRVSTAISSGSLINKRILEKVGLFDDKLFIDYVDNDFCLRVLESGFEIVEIIGVRLNHLLGSMTPHTLFGFTFHTSNHNHLRRYYMFRNRIYVYRKYGIKNFGWIFRDFMRNFTEIIKVIFWEEDKKRKLKFILIGLSDGILNRFGSFEINHGGAKND